MALFSRPSSRWLAVLVVLVVPVLAIVAAPPAAAGADPPAPVTYMPPVDAPVVDGFRPPVTPYGPGNRGFEYTTVADTPVRAAADGTVIFAGVVAGNLHVTLLHADGIRTSYSFLAAIAVHEGDAVAQGAPVGTAGARLFFSARLGDAYLDPAVLLASGPPRVRLVPEDQPDGSPDDEAVALRALGHLETGAEPSVVAATVDWLRRPASVAPSSLPRSHDPSAAATAIAPIVDWWRRRHHCTSAQVHPEAPPGRRIALLVGGLGSSSAVAGIDALDTHALGYAPGDVVRFSYAGGRTPDGTDGVTVAASPYTASDTMGDLDVAADRLVALLDAVAAAAPGTTVDVLGHSQGGVLARAALGLLAGRPRQDPTRAALGVVVTYATPHGGADVAAIVDAVDESPAGSVALEVIGAAIGSPLDPDAQAVQQLMPGSPFMVDLATTVMPAEVPVVSIAARADAVVPAGRSRLPGSTNVVVSVDGWSEHSRLPAAPEAARETALALAGLPPACESFLSAAADGMAAAAVGGILGLATWVVGLTG